MIAQSTWIAYSMLESTKDILTFNALESFQLYVYRERSLSNSLVRRAEASGYKALVLTVDTPILGRRLADTRNRFLLPKPFTFVSKFRLTWVGLSFPFSFFLSSIPHDFSISKSTSTWFFLWILISSHFITYLVMYRNVSLVMFPPDRFCSLSLKDFLKKAA